MKEDQATLRKLLDQLTSGNVSKDEFDALLAAISDDAQEGTLKAALLESIENEDRDAGVPASLGVILQRILAGNERIPAENEDPVPIRRISVWRRVAVAASIILVLGAGAYFLAVRKPSQVAGTQGSGIKNDVAPGGNKAILTLANGGTIVLDSAANGVLTQQGNANVLKTNNGQLAYNTTNEKPTEVLYNTLATPRAGQYQLVLPDGSKVWLNAASSIRYPTAFTGANRQVDITGEVYFDIAKDARKPFIVRLGPPAGGKGAVRVLGTQFNVNVYDDEPAVRTTLVEGSVEVTKDAATALLKPGQQSQLTTSGALKVVQDADVEEAVAWKNGKLSFKHADIATILRQAARWYDVEIVYKAKIEDTYTVDVPRNLPVSTLLHVLEMSSGVHFNIEGKRITVTK